jgi:hypothetical protein
MRRLAEASTSSAAEGGKEENRERMESDGD